MSYDITFIRKTEKQTWQEALQAHEARVMAREPWGAPAPEATRAEWRRIAALLLEVHAGMELTEAPHVLELTDLQSGLQVALYEDEADISVPYWHAGEEAQALVGVMRRLAAIVERETGLVGYDPQLDARFLDAQEAPGQEAAIMTSMSDKIRRGELFGKKERRWWEFWKR